MDHEQPLQLLESVRKRRKDGNGQLMCDQQYDAVYKVLGISPKIRKVAHRIAPTGYDKEVAALFPPCAIPLWDTRAGVMVCEWRHWLISRRPVIGRLYPAHRMVVEWARSYEQLGYLVVQNLLTVEAEMSAELEVICRTLEIKDVDAVLKIWQEYGDRAVGFAKHRCFDRDLPQSCFEGGLQDYHGDFPSLLSLSLDAKLKETCSYEVHDRSKGGLPAKQILSQIRNLSGAPLWLRGESQASAFEVLFQKGDLIGAWMSLCSSGWVYRDAKKALLSLAERVDDTCFWILAEVWCSLPFSDDHRY